MGVQLFSEWLKILSGSVAEKCIKINTDAYLFIFILCSAILGCILILILMFLIFNSSKHFFKEIERKMAYSEKS